MYLLGSFKKRLFYIYLNFMILPFYYLLFAINYDFMIKEEGSTLALRKKCVNSLIDEHISC